MPSRLVDTLRAIVGPRHVLTRSADTRPYRTGFRFGTGQALAVVRPGTLVEMWRVLQACVQAEAIVIAQAANTGLTGGSTPDGDGYDRDVVILSTRRLDTVHLIDAGRQVVCMPGATLHQLERMLRLLGRAPHSEIGSSCIGASVVGGVCNNSGGALVRRGPAYTEMALYARVDDEGRLQLVNHLGIRLPGDDEAVLARLEQGGFEPGDVQHTGAAGSDPRYAEHVRQVDAGTPARYNADPSRLFEASGCAGKLMVFAVRLDTFALEVGAKVFHVATNDPQVLTGIRRDVLQRFEHLPIAGEYMHAGAWDVAERYGKDMFWLIRTLGTQRLPVIFAAKNRVDAWLARCTWLPARLSDRVLQAASRGLPQHLPARMRALRERFEHHLLLKVTAQGADEARAYLAQRFGTMADTPARMPTASGGDFYECTDEEGSKAFLHRFVAAGAATRYRAVHAGEVEDIVALDVALRRNDRQWVETLPPEIDAAVSRKLYYGHFLCHVFHQDYIVKKGHDCLALEHRMWRLLDERGAEYPAEHNVGHLYAAKPALAGFYRAMDPCNCFNVGIGKASRFARYREPDVPSAD